MSFLTIGQIVRMQQIYEEEDKQGAIYKTRVADLDKSYLYLEVPISETDGRPLYAIRETDFIVTYIDSDGNNFHFRTKIYGHKEENIPLIIIEIPKADEIIKTQKRGFFRVKARLDLAISLTSKDRNYHIITKSVDMGGGGLSFLTPLDKTFENGDRLKIWCVLVSKGNSIKRISFDTEVVRVHPPEENNKQQMVSVKFVDLKERESVAIIKYCFDRQIELHKKQE